MKEGNQPMIKGGNVSLMKFYFYTRFAARFFWCLSGTIIGNLILAFAMYIEAAIATL
jgi:hypothetical protein